VARATNCSPTVSFVSCASRDLRVRVGVCTLDRVYPAESPGSPPHSGCPATVIEVDQGGNMRRENPPYWKVGYCNVRSRVLRPRLPYSIPPLTFPVSIVVLHLRPQL